MQKFIAEPSFWEILPEASIGIMVVRAMKTADEVSSEDKATIASILNEANATANQHLTSVGHTSSSKPRKGHAVPSKTCSNAC